MFDPNQVAGKTITGVDKGDIIELEFKPTRTKYKAVVVGFFRAKAPAPKAKANAGTNPAGGELMIKLTWTDAPASSKDTVIGHAQCLSVEEFMKDYKVLNVQVML